MSAALQQILRSRWFVLFLHAALWVFLYLGITNLGGKPPALNGGAPSSTQPQTALPIPKLEPLFASGLVREAICSPTNAPNPFFTRYFVPPAPPAPPPPTTRKLEVTYQGFFQTGNGPKHAVLNLAGGLMFVRVGALLATNVYVADANLQSVILTNTSSQTNKLTLNEKKEIEVPIR
jgi:hypothetical protein